MPAALDGVAWQSGSLAGACLALARSSEHDKHPTRHPRTQGTHATPTKQENEPQEPATHSSPQAPRNTSPHDGGIGRALLALAFRTGEVVRAIVAWQWQLADVGRSCWACPASCVLRPASCLT